MITSKNFWIGTLSLAIIPILLIDLGHHYVDWTKDVHDEMIHLAYNQGAFNTSEKANILDNIFDQNQSLGIQLILKAVLAAGLLVSCVYFLRRYFKQQEAKVLKSSPLLVAVVVLFLCVKVFVMPRMMFNPNVHLLEYEPKNQTFQSFYNANFKGKAVYVDFWGTTCGPCVYEFQHFTAKLKKRYAGKDVAFLYICSGREQRHKYMWREQIEKYKLEGNHIFLNDEEYIKLYNQLTGNNNDNTLIPWYVITDRSGKITDKNAPRPSDKDKLFTLIDRNLLAANK